MKKALVVALMLGLGSMANAGMVITEWMYGSGGSGAEYVEFTNTGAVPMDMTGWSYDDDSRLVGVFSLSGFGTVAPGESVIITEDPSAANFRSVWNLAASVKVLAGYTNNLGRGDEINLFDGSGVLADRLTYGDQVFLGSIRTQGKSGNPISVAALGANDVYQWQLAAVGDSYGSWTASTGDIGNPGTAIPEPATLGLLLIGLLPVLRRR